MIHALCLEPDKPDFIERAGRLGAQVAAAMHAHGCDRVRSVGRGTDRRNVYRKAR
jgi:hypothetical protein